MNTESFSEQSVMYPRHNRKAVPRHAAPSTVFGRLFRRAFGDPRLHAWEDRLNLVTDNNWQIVPVKEADTEPRGLLTPEIIHDLDRAREAGLDIRIVEAAHPQLARQKPIVSVASTEPFASGLEDQIIIASVDQESVSPSQDLEELLAEIRERRLGNQSSLRKTI